MRCDDDPLVQAYVRTEKIIRTMGAGLIYMVDCACCGEPESAEQLPGWTVDSLCAGCLFGDPTCWRCVTVVGLLGNERGGDCHKIGVVTPYIEDWDDTDEKVYMICGLGIPFPELFGGHPDKVPDMGWCDVCYPDKG